MSDPFEWWTGGPDEGRARELTRLRGLEQTIEWLVRNAPPKTWAKAIVKLQHDLSDPNSKASKYWQNNLVYRVQSAMPRRAMTPAEADELTRLLASSDLSPEWQADFRALATSNPGWFLFSLRRFVRSAGHI
jgi:hypothetical protein